MLEDRHDFKAWLYLLPALILLIVFTFYPIINTFMIVFMVDYDFLYGDYTGWTLTGNIQAVLGHRQFWPAIRNTVLIAFVSVPLSVIISLFIAVWLNSIKKLQGAFQTIFFLPYVTNAIAVGLAFAVIFNRDYGLFNYMLSLFGIDPINWVAPGSPWRFSMIALLVFITWNGLAFKIMVFLSGLQSIDKQYYDAARIDSASRSRIFRKITVPLLSPMIAFITITSFIGAFKEYTAIVGMFGEQMGYRGQLITIVGLVYEALGEPYVAGSVSLAASAAIVLFFMTLLLTIFNMWVSKKRVHY